MRNRIQLGLLALVAISIASMPGSGWAQKPHPAGNAAPHADRPPQSQAKPKAQAAHPQNPNANRPPANSNRAPANPNRPANRPPQSNARPQGNFNNGARANLTPRQQLGVGATRPWVDRMRDLSPAQRENVLQNSRAFQNLSPEQQNKIRQQFKQWDGWTPQQRADQRTKEETWRQMTPAQRDHIKNDVLPKWKQMPWDRQQVMRQKLGVLQNMPESARNQRLNDPEFTRGMSDDERSMLHDLSHTHVGGAPEPPGE
jgi:hypothetical protein